MTPTPTRPFLTPGIEVKLVEEGDFVILTKGGTLNWAFRHLGLPEPNIGTVIESPAKVLDLWTSELDALMNGPYKTGRTTSFVRGVQLVAELAPELSGFVGVRDHELHGAPTGADDRANEIAAVLHRLGRRHADDVVERRQRLGPGDQHAELVLRLGP